MGRVMANLKDLVEEFKVRTVYWAICIFAISYFLSHTSKSMWTNIPMSVLILSAMQYLSYEVELCWKDFVVDLWYSSITPDKEVPELIHATILDDLGEISVRFKGINHVIVLTRDMVDVIGKHLDDYRRIQTEVGVDDMGTLSSEERDVVGASFKQTRSKPFAVYSISMTDANYKTWLAERRKDKTYPVSYALLLYRMGVKAVCGQPLHTWTTTSYTSGDLLSIGNVPEQHEASDFLSVSSKNYSFEKAASVMKTLAANVDEAMEDIVHQIKGAFNDLRRIVLCPSSSNITSLVEKSLTVPRKEEIRRYHPRDSYVEAVHSQSAYGPSEKDHHSATNTCHLDNELKSEIFSPQMSDHMKESMMLELGKNKPADKFPNGTLDKFLENKSSVVTDLLQDLDRIPLKWIQQNTSLPLLNLVDKIFLLDEQGWLRRQVFWISKQLLQLMMDDAIDDWMLRKFSLRRNVEFIAQMILWVQNLLWPNGTFFTTSETDTCSKSSTCDTHLEAVRKV